jgi:HK97 family phage portal protein
VKPSFWQGFKSWMGFRADSGGGRAINPFDDRWYGNYSGYGTASGQTVTPEKALLLSAVYSSVRVCCETVSSLPKVIYKRLPDGGKERAVNHPLYKVLHSRPNQVQTSMEWVEMMQGHLELRGNAYSLIQPGPQGAIDQLIPVHPDRVRTFRLPNGRLRYEVRDWYTGELRSLTQDEIFHLRGWSSDGMTGMSTILHGARETVGIGLAQQDYAARFLENDSQPRGVLEHPQTMSQEANTRLRNTFQESQAGANRHKPAILEEGMTYHALTLNNKDSQFLEAREFTRSEIAGMFRVPPHKIGDLTKATFSNIEQQNIEFVVDCVRPRVVRWEERINVDLINPLQIDNEDYFCEFLLDGLLRGDQKSRYEAYTNGRNTGFLSVNDIRRMENLNPIGKAGDEYLRPLNMVPLGTADPNKTVDDAASQEDATAGN